MAHRAHTVGFARALLLLAAQSRASAPSLPLFDRSHPDAAPAPHSNREFGLAAAATPSTASCAAHSASGACEGAGCYWSAYERGCFVKYVPGSEGTFAQNYQDWWVHRVAEANGWGQGSVFLDLGAHSGLWCSNTKLLEQLGWRGVCVEPFPENGPTKGSFEDRSCALVDRALVDREDGRVVTMHGHDAQSMQLKLSELTGGGGGGGGGMEAKTISISSLLACRQGQCPGDWAKAGLADGIPSFVHFVSLDVEGLELLILESFPFDTVRVGVWVIEHNGEEEKRAGIVALLDKHGYRRFDVENAGVDDFFADPQYMNAKEGGEPLTKKPWRVHPHGTFGC